jgi:transcription elongation factor GreA
MRLPKRRHELLKTYEEESTPIPLTAEGLRKLESELKRLETKDVKQAVEDVASTGAFGDRSENAEYQEARHRLSRTQSRIFYLKERLKRVVVIQKSKKGNSLIKLGSTAVVQIEGKERTYEIVGPAESNPTHGRISHVSPLGAALLGHRANESITIQTAKGEALYHILRVD